MFVSLRVVSIRGPLLAVSDEFQSLMSRFSEEHCAIFEDNEENKLEYTVVFKEW